MNDARGARRFGCLSAAVVVALLAAAPAWGQWWVQPITSPGSLTQPKPFLAPPALTFDSQDRPHVAWLPYNSNSVQYQYATTAGPGSVWSLPYNALSNALPGPAGSVHLAAAGNSLYLGYSNGDVWEKARFAVSDGSTWQAYSPTGLPSTSVLGGMATDSTGQPNWILGNSGVALGQTAGFNLFRPSGTNTVQATSLAPNLPAGTTILTGQPDDVFRMDGDMLFDHAGQLQTVQYYEIGGSGFLMYAKGSTAGPFTVDSNVDPSWWAKYGRPSLAVDAADRPHIVYTTHWPYYGLMYAAQTDTGWIHQQIDLGGSLGNYVGTFPDVMVDSFGTVHVVYADGLNGLLKHASLVGGAWQIEAIDTIGKQSQYGVQVGALAAGIDSRDGIGVAYWDGDDSQLKYAYMQVPEPATLLLVLAGAGMVIWGRRARK